MNFTIPARFNKWLDENKGERSRISYILYILDCIIKNGKFELNK